MSIRFVDAHCFAGGLALGIKQGGDFELVAKKESQDGFGSLNMEANRHIMGENWETQSGMYSDWEPIDAQLVASNPPCSAFSLLSSRNVRGMDSKINACMWGVAEYAARVKPEIFVMESVQGAYTQGKDLMVRLRARLEELSGDQYELTHVLHSARSVGSPQLRRRYLMVCHKIPFGLEPPEPQELPTVRDCIDDLRDLRIQWGPQSYKRMPLSMWAATKRSFDGLVDGHMYMQNLSQQRMEVLLKTGRWTPGKQYSDLMKELYENDVELPEIFKSYETMIEANWQFGWRSPGVIRPDWMCPVITGNGGGGLGHYTEPRILTQREVARLMGFPDNWLIEPNQKYKYLNSGWGKGVTVDVGRYFGTWLAKSINGEPGSVMGNLIGERERLINYTQHFRTFEAQKAA
jgi:site-specific DNA-cytosine methylase